MLAFLRDFFLSKQTFQSAAGDLLGVGALVAASPDAVALLVELTPWAPVVVAALAYLGGAISGRKTKA